MPRETVYVPNPCQGACEFHGQLWCKFYNRPCEEYMGDRSVKRAEFVYEGARLAALAAGAPVIPALWADREEPFRAQFLKVIAKQCGPDRSSSPEALHEDWVIAYATMGWTFGEIYDPIAKTHPDMVRYEELGQLEQDKDSVFVALCEIARLWIRDDGGESDDA